jgi:hypothetical protein
VLGLPCHSGGREASRPPPEGDLDVTSDANVRGVRESGAAGRIPSGPVPRERLAVMVAALVVSAQEIESKVGAGVAPD